jgi:hypothetical protein
MNCLFHSENLQGISVLDEEFENQAGLFVRNKVWLGQKCSLLKLSKAF